MDPIARPYRSVLYIPGSKDRALDKARTLPVDAIIFDLEDAVSPDAKIEARATLAAALNQGGYGNRARIIRINGLDTEWGAGDVAALKNAGADAFLLPKVNSAADVQALADLLGSTLIALNDLTLRPSLSFRSSRTPESRMNSPCEFRRCSTTPAWNVVPIASKPAPLRVKVA